MNHSGPDPVETFVAEVAVIRNGRPGMALQLEGSITASGACRLRCVDGEKGYYADDPEDFFSALLDLRTRLERDGVQLLCQGARRDVWPSAMARQMGKGLKAYVCELGKPGTELVEIFEVAPPSACVTVAEQRRYHEQWFELRSGQRGGSP
jgi:hypothetical protein